MKALPGCSGRTKALAASTALVLAGNAAAAISGFASMALAARGLGATSLGILVLVTSYAQILMRALSFNSSHAIIRFGAEARLGSGDEDLSRILKLGIVLDVIAAVITFAIALLIAFPLAAFLDWSATERDLLLLYSIVIPFCVRGTPLGVLRLFDRFDLLAIHSTAVALIRAILIAAAFLMDFEVGGFVFMWGLSVAIEHLLLQGLAIRTMGFNLAGGVLTAPLRGTRVRYPQILSFFVSTNLAELARFGRATDIYWIGSLLSMEAVAIYKIGQKIGDLVITVVNPVPQVLYPEFASLRLKGKMRRFADLVVRSSLVLFALGIVALVSFAAVGRPIITGIFGQEYGAAYLVAMIFLVAATFGAGGQPFTPALLSLDRNRDLVVLSWLLTFIYLVLLYPFSKAWGVTGAAATFLIFIILWVVILGALVRAAMRQDRAPSRSPSSSVDAGAGAEAFGVPPAP